MTVRTYTSEDASAPVLTGAVGSLIALLDACLVNGYGSETAAGWAKSFSGTNLAVYAPAKLLHELQPYYRIDDTATTYAGIAGFRNMTDVNTGLFRFPAIGTNRYVLKTDTAGASPRRWKIVADERTAHIMIQPSISNDWELTHIGAFKSFRPIDPCPYLLEAAGTTGVYGTNYAVMLNVNTSTCMTDFASPTPLAIGYSGKGDAVTGGNHSDMFKTRASSYMGLVSANGMQPINPADGAIHFAPVWIHEPTQVLRGILRGFWNPLGQLPLASEQVITGSGQMAGKTLLGMQFRHAQQCQVAFETSNTWEV
jgi:hypothetical protein